MKKLFYLLFIFVLVLCLGNLSFANPETKSSERELHYQTGKIAVGKNLATVDLPDNYAYLAPSEARFVLEDVWGNPADDSVLGLIVPQNFSPMDENSWAIVVNFEKTGYVKDDEAKKINYDQLLKQMQEGTKENNQERKEQGYEPIELIGWATRPHYDKANHSLYWAKELKFGTNEINTLNYNIRILGRKGVLNLNAVAGMSQLSEIEQVTPQLLKVVQYTKGNRYEDFNSVTDKISENGLAFLIAGGAAAAKTGLLKSLWLLILGAKKLIIAGIVALGGVLAKLFKKNKAEHDVTG